MFGLGRELLQIGGQRVEEFGHHLGSVEIVGLILGLILWALVALTLVLLIIKLIRRLRSGAPAPVPAGPAVDTEALKILQERYARGEIDQNEFLARKKDLSGL
jgi:putative membrane protein